MFITQEQSLSLDMTFKPLDTLRGFTLVELITVIIIVSILAIVSASKFFGSNAFKEAQVQQELLSAFRFAQKIAIASQCPVAVTLTSGANGGYALNYIAPCSGSVKHPANQQAYADNDLGVTLSSSASLFRYDASGNINPATGGTITAGSQNITLEALTGFAHE